jgi:hypothetical protein
MASIFGLEEFKALAPRWIARTGEFARRRSYYDGSAYSSTYTSMGWLGARLGGAIRPLYLPCGRAVNLDSGIVPGGWQTLSAPGGLVDLFERSDWTINGSLYVHYGAQFGNVILRVADVAGGVVQPVSPETCMLVESSLYDRTPRMALTVQTVEVDGRDAEYAEVIEAQRVRTYVDGVQKSVGGRPAEYPNPRGVVPFVEVRHINGGGDMGDCAFQAALALLDTVNELATDLAEIIKRHAKPKWAVIGADETDLSNDDDIWTFPQGSDVKVLVPGIDVTGVLKFLQDTRVQVERSIPELAFDEIVSKYNLATATVELQLAELVLLIKRVRPNYDRGLERACALAGVGGVRFDSERRVLPLDRRQQLELELLEAQVAQTKAAARAPQSGGNDASNSGR